MKKILFIMCALIASLLPVSFAQAATIRTDGTSIDVGEKETVKDLYLFSNDIIVNSPVSGDLVTAGQSIIINGNTENSLFAAGENVAIRGSVMRHLRVAGGTVTLSGSIGGDVFVAADTVNITRDATIGGDLFVAGSSVTVSGVVKGTSKIGGSDVALNGELGFAKIWAGNLSINDSAKLKNGLDYYSPTTANVHSNAKIDGAVNYHKTDNQMTTDVKGMFSVLSLLMLIGSFLLLLAMIKLFRPTIQKLVDNNNEKFLANLGLGFLSLIVAPMAFIILMFSIIGIPFAMLGGMIWVLMMIFAWMISQLFLGAWIYKFAKKQNEYRVDYSTALIGVIAALIIKLIPVVGGLIMAIIFFVSLGSLLGYAKSLRTK